MIDAPPADNPADNPFAAGAAFVDGDYLPVHEARLPLLDWGFIKSDCTYDVAGCSNGSGCLQEMPTIGFLILHWAVIKHLDSHNGTKINGAENIRLTLI